jgi:hypothetical protein
MAPLFQLQNDEELRERLLTALTAQPQVQEMQQEKTPAGEEEGEKGAAKGRQLKQWIRNMVCFLFANVLWGRGSEVFAIVCANTKMKI